MMSETSQEKFQLTITADSITSTDARFTMGDLTLGDNYKPLATYFKPAQGEAIQRHREKREYKISNQTLPRLAFQVFESQLVALPEEERLQFPICQYDVDSPVIRGIFPNFEAYRQAPNSRERESMTYHFGDDQKMVIYVWNIFSTLLFVQECLKRLGDVGDQFILQYRDKTKTEYEKAKKNKPELENSMPDPQDTAKPDDGKLTTGYRNSETNIVLASKNVIFRGAPGTGKSYLAKKIATDIITHGKSDDYTKLTKEQKQQVEFVQFHPSYDYTDFVEGLRPKTNDDGSMGFELQAGVFTRFVEKAQRNYNNAHQSQAAIAKTASVQEQMNAYFSELDLGEDELQTTRGTRFVVTGIDEKHINISAPGNEKANRVILNINELRAMLEADQDFDQVKDLVIFFDKINATQGYSYDLALYQAIKAKSGRDVKTDVAIESQKDYVFIIDEINRGEISKIFGELFFSIDPGYRGRAGEVATQYANMHEDPDQKFYIPENVYIIGTMNDIDRSVDSFDFAMRRRFRFVEIKADEHTGMLDTLGPDKKVEAITRMKALNEAISSVDELNENYHIGAAYFLKLGELGAARLWRDYLQPLLQDYVRGMYDEVGTMKQFKLAYDSYVEPTKVQYDDEQE